MKIRIISRNKGMFVTLILLAAVAVSCKTLQPAIDSKDLSYIYNPTKNPIHPRYNITNQSETRSFISVKFLPTDLFFSEANPEGKPIASMLITVKLYNTTQGRLLADTSYISVNLVRKEGELEYICNLPLSVKPGLQYLAEVKILDRVRAVVVQSFVPFNTLSDNNRYNFEARGYFENNEIFNPVMRRNEYVSLSYLKGRIDSLFISFYKPFRVNPDPPSMLLPEKTIDYGPDTIIPIPYSDTLPMMFPKEGIYLCSTGREIKEGFTFFNFGLSYPEMNSPELMIEPLTYLASEDELNAMRTSDKPKVALDEFWIKCGGNVDKARELIRIYYTRVQVANYYFTSYKEGWRTERGMIYIMYGPPDKVYKSSEGETWGYRKPEIKSSWGYRYRVKEDYLFFNFRFKDNIFTDNDYYLSRSESLVTLWDKAVASWKKGLVFRLDNPEGI
jgi:GWxTD domain-containing protein